MLQRENKAILQIILACRATQCQNRKDLILSFVLNTFHMHFPTFSVATLLYAVNSGSA